MTETAVSKKPRIMAEEPEESNDGEKMPKKPKSSYFKSEELKVKTNNDEHRTLEISETELIVRRGQKFTVAVELMESFNPDLYKLNFCAKSGLNASEQLGTMSCFSIPPGTQCSPDAMVVWKAELCQCSSPERGKLSVIITPPANAPIGMYQVTMVYREEETLLTNLVVLFNPWCPDDPVFLSDEAERQEYVMNEEGLVFVGSSDYISRVKWDFGQFEDDMVKICMMILDKSYSHENDPDKDVSSRADPIYVSRVVSAMINSEDDHGVLEGRWEAPYSDGYCPTHWSESHTILKHWLESGCKPVKYGQCWVFASVMCSVMRLLGIPTRVVTNFDSAHDTNENLVIDTYYTEEGLYIDSMDSIWNFHVWVESWMTRPDLAEDGKFDGWQVVDPTPQELSDGLYCCGPASVKSIQDGNSDLKYDVPFVFAEVNADCVDWLMNPDGSTVLLSRDTKTVGNKISTKTVGEDERMDITNKYKYKEGSKKAKAIFKKAKRKLKSKERDENKDDAVEDSGMDEPTDEMELDVEAETGTEDTVDEPPPQKPLSMHFEEVSKPLNGKDVEMNLVIRSNSKDLQVLSISISVQSKTYSGSRGTNIQSEEKEKDLPPGEDLSIPVLVKFSDYWEAMVDCDTMKLSALVKDKENPEKKYMCEDNVVLENPPLRVTVFGEATVGHESSFEVAFDNPVDITLKDCTLTFSGSGLWKDELMITLSDVLPFKSFSIKQTFTPYKAGKKTLVADFDCSVFRDIKGSTAIHIKKAEE
ncbi:protein-glutamine gamma-glutamyltransferase E-like [Sphaeramia orbicularis]|uniref:protein-glutamine gamma-glutamyltransferase n=1 Tax=Sphaeramia orbicularis TaxID=375764 RepID=A0A673AB58_9TELE|nr:protein-glutamine gamma-glutamyltransferase E-like [Sphaeramia orbicularis]